MSILVLESKRFLLLYLYVCFTQKGSVNTDTSHLLLRRGQVGQTERRYYVNRTIVCLEEGECPISKSKEHGLSESSESGLWSRFGNS